MEESHGSQYSHRLGPPSYPEQEAFYFIDHSESTPHKLVQWFMQRTNIPKLAPKDGADWLWMSPLA